MSGGPAEYFGNCVRLQPLEEAGCGGTVTRSVTVCEGSRQPCAGGQRGRRSAAVSA